jgi:hypothetical protein
MHRCLSPFPRDVRYRKRNAAVIEVVHIHDVAADASGRERKSHGVLDAIDAVAFVRKKMADEDFRRETILARHQLRSRRICGCQDLYGRTRRLDRDPFRKGASSINLRHRSPTYRIRR